MDITIRNFSEYGKKVGHEPSAILADMYKTFSFLTKDIEEDYETGNTYENKCYLVHDTEMNKDKFVVECYDLLTGENDKLENKIREHLANIKNMSVVLIPGEEKMLLGTDRLRITFTLKEGI